jgi:hypothetical protein
VNNNREQRTAHIWHFAHELKLLAGAAFLILAFNITAKLMSILNFPSKGRIVLDAFKTYKHIHGNLRIKIGFEIPSTDQWPKEHHGKKLGRYVDAIRQSIKGKAYLGMDKNDIKKLIDDGFVVDEDVEQENITLEGFRLFKEKNGHVDVGKFFRVPKDDLNWPEDVCGLALGQKLGTIKNMNSFKRIKPALAELGFNVEPDIKYEDMRDALLKYKELEGHAQMPCDFRVPRVDNRYPEHTRGLHLGFAVHSAQVNGCYEQHHDELKQLGVNFKIIGAFHTSFDAIYRAATVFCELHPGKIIPQNFVVPFGDDKYPEDTWGLELGLATYYLLKMPSFYPEYKEKFKTLAVNTENKRVNFDVIYSAFEAYKAMYGNLLVPREFVVPHGDVNYPPDTWGMKLGTNVMSIRIRGVYFEHRTKLEELGVKFEVEKKQHYDFLTQIYPALETYKAIHGDLLVPQNFVVPEGDVRFPAETWGMKLGSIVHTIRNSDHHLKYKERLTALGFSYELKPLDIRGFDVIYSALEAYKFVHGNLLVPQKFLVSEGDVNYPPETWGMKLGHNVMSIRNQGTYSEHRAKLEELGFVYKKNKKIVVID